MNIFDIPYDNIIIFLKINNVEIKDNDKNYEKAKILMKNKTTIYRDVPKSIIEWMVAHNLIFLKIDVPTYSEEEVLSLNDDDTVKLAKLLLMKGTNKVNIINILKYLHKLRNDKLRTTIINLRGRKNEWGPRLENSPKNVIYMGRRFTMGGWDLPESQFCNPFAIKNNITRDNVIVSYKDYIVNKLNNDKDLFNLLKSYKGNILACWCVPDPCHCEVLRDLIDGKSKLGNVVCGAKPGRGQGAYPVVYADNGSEYINIPAFSRGASPWNSLSPFYLKPEIFDEIMPNGDIIERDVTCIENCWQACKIEAKYSREKEGLPPKQEWWDRRNKVWSDPNAHRHVIDKKDRTHPSEGRHYWNGKYISYEEARKEIYIPFYWRAALQNESFQKLVDMRNRGLDFQIIGPDGRNIDENVGLKGELQNIMKPFGHELVLVAMLTMDSIDELLL